MGWGGDGAEGKGGWGGSELSAGKPVTGDGLRLRKKNYYSFPSVNHMLPPGNVEKKGKSGGVGGVEGRDT